MSQSIDILRDAWGRPDFGETSIVVSGQAALDAAIDAHDGQPTLIRLDAAGGPYTIEMRGRDGPLAVASLDPEDPALVTKATIVRSSEVALLDLKIDGGPSDRSGDLGIYESESVAIIGNTATGRADGFLSEDGTSERGDSFALARESHDILFENNSVSDYYHGIGALETTGFVMRGNEISGIQGDGFRGGGLQDALFEGNYFFDFYGSTQTLNHSDMLQIWSQNIQQNNERIVIRDNVFDAGNDKAATQTIFIGHEQYGLDGRPFEGVPYRDITIEGNVVSNGARNGIVVAETENLTVRSNTVFWNETATTRTTPASDFANDIPWIHVVDQPGLVVENNVTPWIAVENGDAAAIREKNVIVDYNDPTDAFYAGKVFVNPEGALDGDMRDLGLRDDHAGMKADDGAAILRGGGENGPVALMSQSALDGVPLGVSISAGLSRIDGRAAEEGEASFLWQVEGDAVFAGPVLEKIFDAPGSYSVTLHMTDAQGRTDTIVRTIEVEDPKLLAFDFSQGTQDLSGYGTETVFKNAPVRDGVFELRDNTSLIVDRREDHLKNMDAFEINLSFAKQAAFGTGAIMGQHQRLSATVERDGSMVFQVNTSEGRFELRTESGLLHDVDRHDLSLRFDGALGEMAIVLDGQEVASGPAAGVVTGNGGHTITLGRAWYDNLEADIYSFEIGRPQTLATDEVDLTPPSETPMPLPIEEGEEGALPAPEDDAAVRLPEPAPAPDDMARIEVATLDALAIGGKSHHVLSDRAEHLWGTSSFELTVDLAKADADATGIIAELYGLMTLRATRDGGLLAHLKTTEDKVTIRTEKGLIDDTETHTVSLRLDETLNELSVRVDGEEVASGEIEGTLPKKLFHDLVVGSVFRKSVDATIEEASLALPGTGSECSGGQTVACEPWYVAEEDGAFGISEADQGSPALPIEI